MKSFFWPNSVFPLLARADVSDLSFHHYKVAEGSSAISSWTLMRSISAI